MPRYEFIDAQGGRHRLRAADLTVAARLAEARLGPGWQLSRPKRRYKVSMTERTWLWGQLAELAAAGAPLPQALVRLGEVAPGRTMRVLLPRLAALMSEGLTLAEAAASLPGLAEEAEIALLEGAEGAGRLAAGLHALARLVEADANTSAALRLRWLYPAFTAAVGLVVLPMLALFLGRGQLARLETAIREAGAGPATGWQTVMGLLIWLPAAVLMVLALGLALAVAGRVRGWQVAPSMERLLYLLPGYGAFRYHRRLAMFFETLALGLEARLPLPALVAAGRATLGPALGMVALRAQVAAEGGAGLGHSLASMELLPAATLARVRAASGGKLSTTVAALAREHRQLADFYARRFVILAEPVMVLAVAVGVAALAAATFGPLLALLRSLAGQG
jgi:type II secretory pathway component PulF